MALVLALPVLLMSHSLKIDHVTVAGSDVRAMMGALANVGLRCEYGGPHADHVTEIPLMSFPDRSYLELIGPQRNADPKAVAMHVLGETHDGKRRAVRVGCHILRSGR